MLTEKEKQGINELTLLMNKEDLVSLAKTIACGFVIPKTPEEARANILLLTDKPIDLLKRRKLKKEFLLKYLIANRVSVVASVTKAEIVDTVLQLWGSPPIASEAAFEEDNPEEPSTAAAPLAIPEFFRNVPATNVCPVAETVDHVNWLSTPIKNAESLDHEPMDCEDGNEVIRTSTSLYRVVPYTDEEITFADSFVKWFYPLLNATFNSEESSKEFGSQHFWIDASAKICLEESSMGSANRHLISHNDSAEQVSETLKDIVRRFQIIFKPNLTRDGVSGKINPYGLGLVSVCGTLHNPTLSCVGIFYQQFGLIRDPSLGQNFKIKFTNAYLISKEGVCEPPGWPV